MRNPRAIIFSLPVILTVVFVSLLPGEETGEIGDTLLVTTPKVCVSGIPFTLNLLVTELPSCDSLVFNCAIRSRETGRTLEELSGVLYPNRKLAVLVEKHFDPGKITITVDSRAGRSVKDLRVLPGILTILPPIIAILFALVFKEVVVSLTIGIWLGALFILDYSPFKAMLAVVDYFAVEVLTDRDHISIVVFTLFLGGLVGVATRSGGVKGIVQRISKFANSAKRGQLATWIIGLLVFFDDYANCLIVGNTMRPITDRLRISREKLSYIVDATAAPVSSIALISTWIGFEVGLIGDGMTKYGIAGDPYLVFLQTIPYRFYPIFSIIMILLVISLDRDLGAMYHCEKRAREKGEVSRPGSTPIVDTESESLHPKGGAKIRWQNAAIPLVFLVVGTFVGLYINGYRNLTQSAPSLVETASINEILAYADSFKVLLWTSFIGTIIAISLAVSQKILSLKESLNSMIGGMRAMMMAMIILVLAWSIGAVCKELETANYIVLMCSDILTPAFLPALTFIMAALISFATGSSWATMAILIPIIIPIAHQVGMTQAAGAEGAMHTLVTSLSSILAGAVFGDHCSPISDTTIMSSMSAGIDHIDHVRTQLPYALTAALIGIVAGDIPSGFGTNPWLSLVSGTVLLYLVVRFLGKPYAIKGG